ncbi:MAG TPA: DUF933 domain-containing protein [bacterium]|nr:DUF933 domain-containing protein [bacterium]
MEIAIVRLPQSGKSTLFKIMTGVDSGSQLSEVAVRGVAKIPDARFLKLVEIFKPAKVTPASVPFVDINARGEGAWSVIRQRIGSADAILHVIDAFTDSDTVKLTDKYQKLSVEMAIADLIMVEARLEKLMKIPAATLKPEEKIHRELLPKVKDMLESGGGVRDVDMSDFERDSLKSFSFLTIKPEMVVVNVAEGVSGVAAQFVSKSPVGRNAIEICCNIESEIAELEQAEREEFMKSLGIDEPAFARIIREAFLMLGRIYYFTVGEDEVRAWVIRKGSTAPQAAAAIHKDFERGFIRAEVVAYHDFINTGCDLHKAKAAGKQRLEGKEYIVADGDIVNFRFNV